MNMENSICYQTLSSAIKTWWSSKPKSQKDKLACYLAILAPTWLSDWYIDRIFDVLSH